MFSSKFGTGTDTVDLLVKNLGTGSYIVEWLVKDLRARTDTVEKSVLKCEEAGTDKVEL
jgi:hypothetical protein